MAKCGPSDFAVVPRETDDLAAILYTSGTTGRSKGAMLTHGNLASNALGLVESWRFTDKDVLVHALPIFHSHGLFVGTNVTLMAGASMIFLPKFDADAIIAALPRATAMMGVPTFYTRLLTDPRLTRDLVGHMRALHLRLGPASRRDPPRIRGPHRPQDPRALRHDRNQYEHVQPL